MTRERIADLLGLGVLKGLGHTPASVAGRVRHYYKFGGVWYKPIDETIPENQMWRWTHYGSFDLNRAVTHSRKASGFVRAASHFNI